MDNAEPLNSNHGPKRTNSKFRWFSRQISCLLAIVGFLAFFILLIIYLVQQSKSTPVQTYNNTYPLTKPIRTGSSMTFRIGVITDLDVNSANEQKNNTWKAYMKRGYLSYNPKNKNVEIKWDPENPLEPQKLVNGFSYKGKGMELSELVTFDGKLLTVDDKTGIVYEVVKESELVPWIILADGDGSSTKGFKAEWATVKDEKLYVGGHGTEKGTSLNDMYVKQITPNGQVSHINWINEFKRIRAAKNITYPGYMTHESGAWSDVHKKWFFLPRKCSQDPYNPDLDDKLGCNFLFSTDEGITDIQVTELRTAPNRGYSSFKFVPTSEDTVIVAIRTEEIGDFTASYVSAFTVKGQILLDDAQISDLKYEGIEFI